MRAAKKTSKNRVACTMVAVDVNMDGEKFREMVIKVVYRANRKKMGWAELVKVQWDNARLHTAGSVTRYIKAAWSNKAPKGQQRVPIEIVDQSAQSPNTNCNDLVFCVSIDSHMPEFRSLNVDKLYDEVCTAWASYPSENLH